jgi:precorrin-6Y C5,15-methyltransferase (decarboxylating)
MQTTTKPWLSIIGIGEDGFEGLNGAARKAIGTADRIYGGARHLSFVPPAAAELCAWKSPISQSIDEIVQEHRGHGAVVVLASGDPMLHGIGPLLTRRLYAGEYQVIPHVSAFSLACARMGWPAAEITLVSVVHEPVESVVRFLAPSQRLIVYSRDRNSPGALVRLLQQHGFGPSRINVFERLGGQAETRNDAIASEWRSSEFADLNLIAVDCVAEQGAQSLSLIPGLPDDAFDSDGQLTKREVRAATLSRLAPLPGQLLWDVGAGTGTIGIEWMRAHRSCRCIAFEQREDRAERIRLNANHLGAPGLQVVVGSAPSAFEGCEQPNAIFLGGGVSEPGLLEICWDRLPIGGRLVANTVTVAGETALAAWQAKHGGDLTRIAITRAAQIGELLAWRPLSPITQLAAVKL